MYNIYIKMYMYVPCMVIFGSLVFLKQIPCFNRTVLIREMGRAQGYKEGKEGSGDKVIPI